MEKVNEKIITVKTKGLFNAIVLAVLSLPFVMSCGQGVEIDGLVWMEENVGISKTNPYGSYYDFDKAQTACPRGWRLPTKDEFEMLSRNYSEAEAYNGIVGRWFSGSTPYKKGVKAIFLPMAGGDIGKGPEYVLSRGYYWSSAANYCDDAYYLYFNGSGVYIRNYGRSNAYSVRCLKN